MTFDVQNNFVIKKNIINDCWNDLMFSYIHSDTFCKK